MTLSIDPWQNLLIIISHPLLARQIPNRDEEHIITQTPVALMPKQNNSQLSVERSNLCS
jgi:hypothetical protein